MRSGDGFCSRGRRYDSQRIFIMEDYRHYIIILSLLYYHINVPGKPSVAVIVIVRPVTFSVSDVSNKRFPYYYYYYYCLPRRPRLWLSVIGSTTRAKR